jgi:hypothetical protein
LLPMRGMHVRITRAAGLLTAAFLPACPGESPPRDEALLVVGVQADDFGPLASGFHVVVKRDGAVVRDERFPPGSSPSTGGPTLPKEFEVRGPPGARVDVLAEALPASGSEPLVSRIGSARLLPTGKRLLRLQFENRCILFPPDPGLSPATVRCAAPLTCIAGSCAPSEVADDALEDWEAVWPLAPPDICRPAKRGPPEVIIGTGQTDYATLVDGQVLELEKGPQGGHHLWIAARMKNLRQSGSTTTVTSRLEGDDQPVPPLSFVFTFERDEGSFCKIWGLRYQVDVGATDLGAAYKRFLGKRLAVTVEVLDSTGTRASSTRTIQVADKLLCPDGTQDCNR